MKPSRFTGEFFVPGESGVRIEADHLARYAFAVRWAAGRTILDIACGSGYGTKLLATSGALRVVGVDISPDALSIAREGYDGPAVFELGDINRYGATDSVDMITCFETIEHVPTATEALPNLRRVLRQGGVLLISSPNRRATSPRARSLNDRPKNKFHRREYVSAELRSELRAAGYVVQPELLGQRLQPRMPRLPAAAYRRLFSPHENATPDVRPVPWWAMPRYFILVAH